MAKKECSRGGAWGGGFFEGGARRAGCWAGRGSRRAPLKRPLPLELAARRKYVSCYPLGVLPPPPPPPHEPRRLSRGLTPPAACRSQRMGRAPGAAAGGR